MTICAAITVLLRGRAALGAVSYLYPELHSLCGRRTIEKWKRNVNEKRALMGRLQVVPKTMTCAVK